MIQPVVFTDHGPVLTAPLNYQRRCKQLHTCHPPSLQSLSICYHISCAHPAAAHLPDAAVNVVHYRSIQQNIAEVLTDVVINSLCVFVTQH